MKIFSVLLLSFIALLIFGLSTKENHDQHIDDWAKQTVQLFEDTATFFASLKSDSADKLHEMDDELKQLLPSESVDLRYEPNLDETLEVSSNQPMDITPSALLPDLFNQKQETGTSVKGKIYTDEKDKIIGGQVQLAIPTDM